MKWPSRVHCSLTVALLMFGSLARAASPQADEPELRRMTQELLDAVAPGQTEVWERYLNDDFIQMDENGIVRNKPQTLAELRPLPAGLEGRIAVDRFQVVFVGEAAVAAVEIQEHLDYHGQIIRSRFRSLDTWHRTASGWRLAGQHVAAVLKDPPAAALAREQLCAYEGVYVLKPGIETTIRCGDDGLSSQREDRPSVNYLAELADVFFAPGQPRTRRIFMRDAAGRVTGFVDRREGADVRWTRR
jgi:hypothetical protein